MTTRTVPVIQCDLCGVAAPDAPDLDEHGWITDRARDVDYCPGCASHAVALGLVEVVDPT